MGFALAEKWRLPVTLQAEVRHHHKKDPSTRASLSVDLNQSVDVVLISNLFIHALKFGHSGHSVVEGAPKDILARLTISEDRDLKPLLKEIKQNLDKASDFLRVLNGE